MKRWLIVLFSLGLLAPAAAFWQSRDSNYNVAISAGSSYTGPGDTFSTSPLAAYSCSEAYNAAGANTSTSACDLVDSSAPTSIICTLRFTSTGKVDLTAYCPGSVTPAAKCAAATGGICNISKAYDLTGSGNHAVQTTAANQPTLSFSSTPLGTLPAINCGISTGTIDLITSGTFTQTEPITMAAVYNRNSGTTTGGVIGGSGSTSALMGPGSANTAVALSNSVNVSATATDSAWHAVIGLFNGAAASAINVDGTDTTGSTGTIGFVAVNIRLCRAGLLQHGGPLAEAQVWATSTNPTNRGAISTNAHSSGRYNF